MPASFFTNAKTVAQCSNRTKATAASFVVSARKMSADSKRNGRLLLISFHRNFNIILFNKFNLFIIICVNVADDFMNYNPKFDSHIVLIIIVTAYLFKINIYLLYAFQYRITNVYFRSISYHFFKLFVIFILWKMTFTHSN